jgi:hypothetical protein
MDVSITHDLATDLAWPHEGVTRVPFRVFSDPAIFAEEQKRLFRGPIWNFLCLEVEIPRPGDWRLATVGETPVVVTRDEHGTIHAMVNRCAHKGALVCLQERGNAKALTCVYRASRPNRCALKCSAGWCSAHSPTRPCQWRRISATPWRA